MLLSRYLFYPCNALGCEKIELPRLIIIAIVLIFNFPDTANTANVIQQSCTQSVSSWSEFRKRMNGFILGNANPGGIFQTRVYGFDGLQTRVPGYPGL